MAAYTLLGDGTITIGETPTAFSGEVLGAKVTHTYEEVGEARTMLDGTERPATKKRTDGLTFNVENDLTATGLYQYLFTNDLTEQPVVFTPNTAGGAKWEGDVVATLPANIGADEHGSPIVSSVEWSGVGRFTFTAETAAP